MENYRLAGTLDRFIAFLLDSSLLISFLNLSLFFMYSDYFNQIVLLFLVIIFFYFPLSHSIFGQTLGMNLMGIRLVGENGLKLGFIRALFRFVMFLISLPIFFISHTSSLYSKKGFNLYDYIVNSFNLSVSPDKDTLFKEALNSLTYSKEFITPKKLLIYFIDILLIFLLVKAGSFVVSLSGEVQFIVDSFIPNYIENIVLIILYNIILYRKGWTFGSKIVRFEIPESEKLVQMLYSFVFAFILFYLISFSVSFISNLIVF